VTTGDVRCNGIRPLPSTLTAITLCCATTTLFHFGNAEQLGATAIRRDRLQQDGCPGSSLFHAGGAPLQSEIHQIHGSMAVFERANRLGSACKAGVMLNNSAIHAFSIGLRRVFRQITDVSLMLTRDFRSNRKEISIWHARTGSETIAKVVSSTQEPIARRATAVVELKRRPSCKPSSPCR